MISDTNISYKLVPVPLDRIKKNYKFIFIPKENNQK